MARIFQEGFETYANGTCDQADPALLSVPTRVSFVDSHGYLDSDKYAFTNVHTDYARPGGLGAKGLRMKFGRSSGAGANGYEYYGAMHIPLGGDKTHVFYRTYLRLVEYLAPTSSDSAYQSFISFDWMNGSNRCGGITLCDGKAFCVSPRLYVNKGGSTDLSNNTWLGETFLGRGIPFPGVGANWHLFEAEIKFETVAANSYVKVWIDGTQYCHVIGDITDGETTGFNTLRWALIWSGRYNYVATNFIDMYFDDMAVNDTSGTTNNGRCGGGSIVAYSPTGDGTAQGWTLSAGTDAYALVDDLPATGGDHLSAATASLETHFTTTVSTAAPYINNLSIGVDGGAGDTVTSFKGQFKPNGGSTETASAAITIAEGADSLSQFGPTYDGTNIFTPTNINAGEWGIESNT